MRYAARTDTTQKDIVAALRQAGAFVWIIREPVDLLVWYQGKFSLMDAKSPKKTSHRRLDSQKDQDALCKAFDIPRPTSPEAALAAIGATPPLPLGPEPTPAAPAPARRQTGFHVIHEYER